MEDKDHKKKVEIEINPFLIIYKVRMSFLSKSFILTWALLVIAIVLLYIVSHFYEVVRMESFSISEFFTPAITGLSFTLALIVATTRIFSKEQLVDIYNFTDKDNQVEGYLFYRTIAPFIWTSSIWLIIAIGALIAKIFIFDFPALINGIINILYSSTVLMGVMSLWGLLSVHIGDIILETEREINK